MNVTVAPYTKPDGYRTRFWAVYIDGELLAVTLYRRGADAVVSAITNPRSHATISKTTQVVPAATGVATRRP